MQQGKNRVTGLLPSPRTGQFQVVLGGTPIDLLGLCCRFKPLTGCRGSPRRPPELWGCTRGGEAELGSLGKPPKPRRWASLTPQIAAGTWGVGGKEGRDLTSKPTGKARWGGFCTKHPLSPAPHLCGRNPTPLQVGQQDTQPRSVPAAMPLPPSRTKRLNTYEFLL